ncbi:MAG TPA: glycoside hydrolase family 57 protein [Candidatus Acidoferrales bacterium]|nr:glycoside hydrolase family 57 protein [Candidatus Acidoferrales bacterium]
MSQIYLCFLWHMHQPFYKDLGTGEYRLPWTRMHALKDYYGMARILEEFPAVKQTFNLVPSMMVQVEEYASGEAHDPFLELALKPAESLTDAEKELLLKHSFYSDPSRMIYRYPRYGQLFDSRNSQYAAHARTLFGPQEFRDLQMWSQLAWFDEEFQEQDPVVREWVSRGRDFSPADLHRMGEKQREIVGRVLPQYARLAASGQIEISTTPYYHPILPLLCDSQIASVAHPNVPLPPRFRYPGDAHKQLQLAREYVEGHFGVAPVGLWPSEGSVSDEVLAIASELGFEWAATDSGVLNRTRDRAVSVEGLYRPYEWRQHDCVMRVIFRDHYMSDLIGFVYSKMEAGQAAGDFLHRIHENCCGILARGADALVPIILDGENAWEYYHHNGRPFLRELYRRISEDGGVQAVTVSEALRLMAPEPLDHIFPGSWINANFDVWIGAEEDNNAWTQLLRARATYDAATGVPEERRRMAFEELLIAEGSDWCWWYGPEHDSANRTEFDQLYRSHLANVYRFLSLAPPEELSRPILRTVAPDIRLDPTGPIHPVIDGEVTSYFEWLGAGVCRVDDRSGAMHGSRPTVREVHFGTDGHSLFLRVDFHPGTEVAGLEARLTVQGVDGSAPVQSTIRLQGEGLSAPPPLACAFKSVLEVGCPLSAAQADSGSVRFQLSIWKNGLPVDAVPRAGWVEVRTADLLN